MYIIINVYIHTYVHAKRIHRHGHTRIMKHIRVCTGGIAHVNYRRRVFARACVGTFGFFVSSRRIFLIQSFFAPPPRFNRSLDVFNLTARFFGESELTKGLGERVPRANESH